LYVLHEGLAAGPFLVMLAFILLIAGLLVPFILFVVGKNPKQ